MTIALSYAALRCIRHREETDRPTEKNEQSDGGRRTTARRRTTVTILTFVDSGRKNRAMGE